MVYSLVDMPFPIPPFLTLTFHAGLLGHLSQKCHKTLGIGKPLALAGDSGRMGNH